MPLGANSLAMLCDRALKLNLPTEMEGLPLLPRKAAVALVNKIDPSNQVHNVNEVRKMVRGKEKKWKTEGEPWPFSTIGGRADWATMSAPSASVFHTFVTNREMISISLDCSGHDTPNCPLQWISKQWKSAQYSGVVPRMPLLPPRKVAELTL